MSLLTDRPNTIAKVLDSGFKLYIVSFKKLVFLALTAASAGLAFNVLVQIKLPVLENATYSSTGMPALSSILAALAFYGMATMVLYVAMVYRIDNLVQQREDSISEAVMIGLRKLPGMLLASILYLVTCIAGMLLLVIPGIILSLSLIFYSFVLVLQDQSAYRALKSSHKLVWGNWWRTLTVFMVPGIIVMIVFIMLGIIAGMTNSLSAHFSWMDVVSNLFMAIYLPFFYCLGYVQYRDLELRVFGGDLEARMAQS